MTTTKQPKKISAIIFDLDGTLLDTLEDIAQSMNRVLKRHGYAAHPVEDYRVFVGEGLKPLAEKAIQQSAHSEESADELYEELFKEYELSMEHHTTCYEGIHEMLDDLFSKQIPMAILSNKQDHLTQKLAKTYLSKWPFRIISGSHKNYPKKPNAALALDIANRLGGKNEECIFIGDTETDIQTAKNGGMFSIGAEWGFRNKEILLNAGADFIAEKPGEISEFISGYYPNNE
ncbi:MAG: HAD family hydrolase [Fidelibacterota bacterium]